MMTQKEAEKILSDADTAIASAQAEAVRELAEAQAAATEHAATIRSFRETGHGILSAVEARAFIESLDALLFRETAINSATADARRSQYFNSSRARLAGEACAAYLRENATRLASAIEAVIFHRSRGRTQWRAKMADEIQVLERKQLLDSQLTDTEAKRLDALDRALARADDIFAQAGRALEKFVAQPSSEFFNEARMFASQISYDLQS
jgi:hypothetical protein